MNCLKACSTNRIWRTARPLSLKSTSVGGDSADTSTGIPEDDAPADASTDMPEEPTTCCMSGCANCVWLDYAEQLSKRFDHSGPQARDIILSKITDPNMKAFLGMELKHLEKTKGS